MTSNLQDKLSVRVEELLSFTEQDYSDIAGLVKVLSPRCSIDKAALEAVIADSASHLFVMRPIKAGDAPGCGFSQSDGRIVGCCTVCLFASPTGVKASIEDVVVNPSFQGNGLGRLLVESALGQLHAIAGCSAPIHIQLTSKPGRVAANALYRSLGFKKKETNVYVLDI